MLEMTILLGIILFVALCAILKMQQINAQHVCYNRSYKFVRAVWSLCFWRNSQYPLREFCCSDVGLIMYNIL